MRSVEHDVRGGPQPMEGVEMQRRDRERDRDGHRDRNHGGPIHLDDRSRDLQIHRGNNDRQQLGPTEMDKLYPGMGTGAGGISTLADLEPNINACKRIRRTAQYTLEALSRKCQHPVSYVPCVRSNRLRQDFC